MFDEKVITNLRLTCSTASNITKEVLAYNLPLDKVSNHMIVGDIRKICSALVPGFNEHYLNVSVGRGGYSWQHDSGYRVQIKTSSYRHGPRRSAQLSRIVRFDKELLSLEKLVEAAKKVVELEAQLTKENNARRREEDRRRKIKTHAMKFIGVTRDNSRTKVMVNHFEYDYGKPEKTEITLEIVGDPKKLKKAIATLAKLGVCRGRKS